jgi:hypothetical protein
MSLFRFLQMTGQCQFNTEGKGVEWQFLLGINDDCTASGEFQFLPEECSAALYQVGLA